MSIPRRLVPALLLALVSGVAHADERILHFLSDVQIERDSSLEVTETIDVRAEHVAINHGIYRDFPTRYRTPGGGQVSVGFTLEGATLDGQPVPATTESFANGIRIKVGDPQAVVDVGEHEYVLHYHTTRQIGRFADHDELYWNATGNGWMFPIDVAEARIRLPQPVSFTQQAVYTGSYGSKDSNAEVEEAQPGEILFRTTQPLGPQEGLTVAAGFPKGVVAAPSRAERVHSWLADYGPTILGALCLVGLCFFYYAAWQRVGRDPKSPTVVPLFSPPDGLSPAGMRYIIKEEVDDRAFAAALVDMGVRGHIRMVEENGGWLEGKHLKIERVSGKEPLPADEEATLHALILAGDSITIEQENHESFSLAKQRLSTILGDAYDGKLFERNDLWAIFGFTLSIGAIGLTWVAVAATGDGGSWLPLLFPALGLPLAISAFWWISAPTEQGETILGHVAGFKQYLSVTERERLDRMTPPADTPELFERYLPYAIALGVENHWADRFSGVLADAQAQGRQGFAWYSGSNSPWTNPGRFAQTVGSSLASTISAASAAPGSSSGLGGGGSAGGGGGGGGGGGW